MHILMHVSILFAWFYFAAGEFNDVFARTISPIYSIIFLITTYRICQALYNSKRISNLSILMLLSTPIFVWGAIGVNSDIIYATYCVASLYFAILFLKTQNKLFLLPAGIMAAFSSWTKYLGLIFTFFIIIVIILIKTKEYEMKMVVKNLVTFLLGFSIVLPFYFYNWLFLGNPVYPYLYTVFGGKNFDPWIYENITSVALIPEFTFITLSHFQILPLLVSRYGVIQIFLSIIMLLNLKKFSQIEIKLWVLSIGFFIVWYFTMFGSTMPHVTRYLMPLVSVTSIFSAKNFYDLIAKERFKVEQSFLLLFVILISSFSIIGFLRPEWIHQFYIEYWISKIIPLDPIYIVLIVIMFLFFLLVMAYFYFKEFRDFKDQFLPILKSMNFRMLKCLFLIGIVFFSVRSLWSYKYPVLLGPIPSDDEIITYSHGDNYITVKWINDNLPQDAIVLTTSHRRYYLNVEVFPADSPPVKIIYENKTLDQCLLKLKELEITHIWREYRLDSIVYENLEDSRYFELLFSKGENYVYKINYDNL